jgi:hypothetical protein
MTDPYRIVESPEETEPAEQAPARGRTVRRLLWLLLVISAAANMATSTADINVFVGAGFGLMTLACATGLIVLHYRNRRR